jgi:hypothetical protein
MKIRMNLMQRRITYLLRRTLGDPFPWPLREGRGSGLFTIESVVKNKP